MTTMEKAKKVADEAFAELKKQSRPPFDDTDWMNPEDIEGIKHPILIAAHKAIADATLEVFQIAREEMRKKVDAMTACDIELAILDKIGERAK